MAELWEEVLEAKEKVMREVKEGGDLKDLPCPFCKLPRCSRSDYVRCSKCGINWLQSEMHLRDYLNRNPAAARSEAARMTQTASATRSTATQSKADADEVKP